jgi:ABC-type multidrug transport system fused ATPase/permease subunit
VLERRDTDPRSPTYGQTLREYWFKGGRGSTKSSFISLMLVLHLVRFPKSNAIVFVKIAENIRDSVYKQIRWAIDHLGLTHLFKCITHPFRCEYLPTGQEILFRGLDKAGKIKGIRPTIGVFDQIWFEELTEFEKEVELRNVGFHYQEGGRDVLKNINLTVPKGKTIALVGQSGSGKSTLVDLIPRYHDVCEGQILIDGKDVKNVGIRNLRSLIGNVNQEAILFNDTFYNNITFGVENATMEQVIEAAKIANAHDFIMESESGYDTMIGDRGGRLSGGQRQRISIARAILKNPPILILDEATSALDTESERLVQEALERLMKSRTTIAIAHRLSTIKNADEIFVLYEGEIVERGSHDELIARNGYYKRLYDMQQL